jgi:hypothetical protein
MIDNRQSFSIDVSAEMPFDFEIGARFQILCGDLDRTLVSFCTGVFLVQPSLIA